MENEATSRGGGLRFTKWSSTTTLIENPSNGGEVDYSSTARNFSCERGALEAAVWNLIASRRRQPTLAARSGYEGALPLVLLSAAISCIVTVNNSDEWWCAPCAAPCTARRRFIQIDPPKRAGGINFDLSKQLVEIFVKNSYPVIYSSYLCDFFFFFTERCFNFFFCRFSRDMKFPSFLDVESHVILLMDRA